MNNNLLVNLFQKIQKVKRLKPLVTHDDIKGISQSLKNLKKIRKYLGID